MASQVVCENIGPKEARKRLAFGALLLLVSMTAAVSLVVYGAPRMMRLGLFFPLWGAALGYYQARERTCVALAARGARNLDRVVEAVSDPALVAASRRQARRVHQLAAVTAVVATALLMALPLR